VSEILSIFAVLTLLTFIILVHEMGHAVAGLAFGLEIDEIRVGFPKIMGFKIFGIPVSIGLIPLFGVARIEINDIHWLKKAIVAIAGPLSNFVFAFFAYALAGTEVLTLMVSQDFLVVPTAIALVQNTPLPFSDLSNGTQSLTGILVITGDINIILAVFNLFPVPILDGGRVFFAVAEGIFGNWVEKVHTFLIPISVVALIAWFWFR
jgi:membrane-associated protease RseP (regulator of RpoE activity)